MTTFLSPESEYHEIYEEFSSGRARLRTLNELGDLIEDSVYWVERRTVDVDNTKQFFFLSCRIRRKQIEEVDGMKRCFQCGKYTFRDIFRYNVEVIVADDSGSSTFVLWNKACEKLIGEPAADVIAQYDDTAGTMPQSIKEQFLGQKGLFEEIKELYIKKNCLDYESSSDEDSFLKTLDYVEVEDRVEEDSVQVAEKGTDDDASKGSADELDPDAIHTPKRQKNED
ncbi:procollagen-proline 4-dioxygenase [Castilleja foliolosa]|uniref:Procollagen-proline 4-dioxygenase n=1 Tax=Castilleja foliolosa TaxID=1961234 RepID=A0ABD3E0D0_9LAMI